MRDISYRAYILILLNFAVFLLPLLCRAEYFSTNASYKVCFTPGDDCTKMIIDEMAEAKKQILVQMYIFTNYRLAQALLDAKRRGIDVKVLLDRNQTSPKYSSIKFFKNNNIPVYIDCIKDGLAHNKVMLIDEAITIGGSFNFTNTAQRKNLENVLIIKDPIFTKKFLDNWNNRYGCSALVKKSESKKNNKK